LWTRAAQKLRHSGLLAQSLRPGDYTLRFVIA